MTELLAAAELDMQWHTLPADAPLQKPDEFEQAALEKTHLLVSYVPPRYRSSYFSHIWGNGYAAGYYAYLWTQMLDDDAYQWFVRARRPDARQRRPLPRDGAVARQYAGPRDAVRDLARRAAQHRADAEVPRPGNDQQRKVAVGNSFNKIPFQPRLERDFPC